jgi:hypothetical protein
MHKTDVVQLGGGGEIMKTRVGFLVVVAFGILALLPTTAAGSSATESFDLVMDGAQVGVAANGDVVEVFGGGSFQVNPKSVAASGTFVHKDSSGGVLGGGTWTATELLSFQPYGCRFIPALDVDLGSDDLCGGALKMRVELAAGSATFDGILTVFCIVGPKAPSSHNTPPGEGVTLDIPGVINFNHTVGGGNIYVRTS